MTRLLVIDDDDELAELLVSYLGSEGFEVDVAHDGSSGLERARRGEHELIVLDVMLPGLGGFDVLRELRKTSRIPVVMLTARGEDVDRIVGLELGADDYLPKPFNPRELVARIRAIFRRAAPDTPEKLVVDDVEVDPAAHVARRGGEELSLTTAELAVLELLLKNVGRVVSREDLSDHALGRAFSPLDRSIDVHVSNLRKKLGGDRIRTVRGAGYLYALR
ncbi:MAG: response regulator transcription factor [Sandaracinus sp.]|nr:response regulator transcription factor [Sandaracinus sp.]MCB9637113.1 response regulator transcription factor [Sandaracinus sp.]